MLIITVFSKASLAVEKGIGRIYRQSRGVSRKTFLTPSDFSITLEPPQREICSVVPDQMQIVLAGCGKYKLRICPRGYSRL